MATTAFSESQARSMVESPGRARTDVAQGGGGIPLPPGPIFKRAHVNRCGLSPDFPPAGDGTPRIFGTRIITTTCEPDPWPYQDPLAGKSKTRSTLNVKKYQGAYSQSEQTLEGSGYTYQAVNQMLGSQVFVLIDSNSSTSGTSFTTVNVWRSGFNTNCFETIVEEYLDERLAADTLAEAWEVYQSTPAVGSRPSELNTWTKCDDPAGQIIPDSDPRNVIMSVPDKGGGDAGFAYCSATGATNSELQMGGDSYSLYGILDTIDAIKWRIETRHWSMIGDLLSSSMTQQLPLHPPPDHNWKLDADGTPTSWKHYVP